MVTQAPAEFEVLTAAKRVTPTQDSPGEHATVEDTIEAAVHTTLDMNLESMIAIDDLPSPNFTLSGNVLDSQDSHFRATDNWQDLGNTSITNMQAGPISLTPTSITSARDNEWDKTDFLGDDL